MQRQSSQITWSWKIAAYLFLAGTGSGSYVASAVLSFLGTSSAVNSTAGIVLGAPLVFLGMLFLIADLGVRKNAFRAFVNIRSSWMARGAWIISIFTIFDATQIAALLGHVGWPPALSIVTIVLAVATMFYTGFLLKACRGILFWNTTILPLLFLVSASSTGVMAVVLSGAVYGSSMQSLLLLSQADGILILAESVVIAVYLLRGNRLRARNSVQLWLRGRLATGFWVGVVLCGLLVPLAADAYPANILTVSVSMSLGLAGGLVLRKITLAAGIKAPLEIPPLDSTWVSS